MKALPRAALGLALVALTSHAVASVEFTVLHEFPRPLSGESTGLVEDAAGVLYGVAPKGGRHNRGGVYSVKKDGTSFHILHEFAGAPSDGADPVKALALDGAGTLYGVTPHGGSTDSGAVFRVSTDGSGFALIHSFSAVPAYHGADPRELIADANGYVYGTADGCPASGESCLYKLSTDGATFTVLRNFNAPAGLHPPLSPVGALALDSGGRLYGVTGGGGIYQRGTVYRVKTSGQEFSVIHSFAGGKNDGAYPETGVTLDGSGNLYGVTPFGGSDSLQGSLGAVYTLQNAGAGFKLIRRFEGLGYDWPISTPTLDSSGNLYGLVRHWAGSGSGWGGVYKVKIDGGSSSLLYSYDANTYQNQETGYRLIFDPAGRLYGPNGNSVVGYLAFSLDTTTSAFSMVKGVGAVSGDGWDPSSALVSDGAGTLYGVTRRGGSDALGTIYAIGEDGTDFTVLHEFAPDEPSGKFPSESVVLGPGNRLYGTTSLGATNGLGAVFAFDLDEQSIEPLHAFAGAPDGYTPGHQLAIGPDDRLYGTTSGGGTKGAGIAYALETDGSVFQKLRDFDSAAGEGAYPSGGLIVGPDQALYGTTGSGGPAGGGTVFRLSTDGTSYDDLKGFNDVDIGEGRSPTALTLAGDGLLYGTTVGNQIDRWGGVFRVAPDGGQFSVLHEFAQAESGCGTPPLAGVADGTVFGANSCNSYWSVASVFRLSSDGRGFRLLSQYGGPTQWGGIWSGLLARESDVVDLFGAATFGIAGEPGFVYRLRVDEILVDSFE